MQKEINIRELKDNFVKMISNDWALLTAGKSDDFNTMTVSWGGIGELWNKDVCFVFVRPQRYTYEFMEKNDYFSLSFFGGEYKKELGVCGSKSGRDIDKMAETGFIPVDLGEATGFEQAKVNVVLKKLAYQDIKPDGFVDESIMNNYANNDFHRVYVGEIVKVVLNDEC
ncbi:MAG: flavin reductase family protein [Clostridia bacterium]|nr:flavin reductase family protein [Clostridia bacterium]